MNVTVDWTSNGNDWQLEVIVVGFEKPTEGLEIQLHVERVLNI